MDSVFEVYSPILNSDDMRMWIQRKIRDIVSDVEMFKRMGLILDYVIVYLPRQVEDSNKNKLDIRGVFKGGTVFSLRVDFNLKNIGHQFIVLCDVGFSWITPHNKARKRLASIRDLKKELRQKKFWHAFSKKKESKILVRWDNKPYHNDAGTWPFHKHFGGQKVPASPSQEQSVVGFLEFVKTHLGK